jgi:hypothetical protein
MNAGIASTTPTISKSNSPPEQSYSAVTHPLNGKEFETLWMPPFALDVTDALKTGDNKLTVLVTSTSQGKPKLGDVKLRAVLSEKLK